MNSNLFLTVLFCLGCLTSSCYFGKALLFFAPGVNDYKKFSSYEALPDSENFEFTRNLSQNELIAQYQVPMRGGTFNDLQAHIVESKTTAFMVIKNDQIRYRYFAKGYDQNSRVTSFSVAKAFLGSLMVLALEDGFIESFEDPVTKYLPELLESDPNLEQVTLWHLMQMTSGIRIKGKDGNPFGDLAKLYYGRNLWKRMTKLKTESPPGSVFRYNSADSQLLGFVLERATGKKPTEYLEEKIWSKIGTSHSLLWSTDRKNEGDEKVFCCVNAIPEDYAKFGRLFMQKGRWNGEEIIPEERISDLFEGSFREYCDDQFCNHWWPTLESHGDFAAIGHLGQYVYVHPDSKTIILRFGKKRMGKNAEWLDIFRSIRNQLPG